LIAAVIDRAEHTGHYLVDGHRSARAWAQATCNWSRTAALAHLRVARLVRGHEAVGLELTEGRLGVPQVAELARLYANPRCGHLLGEALDVLIEAARTMRFEDFAVLCRRWESQADEDGARQDHRTAREGRRVRTGITGESFTMTADGDSIDGAEIIEILDRFCDAEFLAEWDRVRERLGESATKADMERSNAQRRFDALVTIFRAAAAANQPAPATEPTVNINVDLDTFERHLLHFCGLDTIDDEPIDDEPIDDGLRRMRHTRCETSQGHPVDPDGMIAAALIGRVRRVVLDGAGRVIDLGRRRRLFTGAAAEALRLSGRRCIWPGCSVAAANTQCDHVDPWVAARGPTSPTNGALLCGFHNRFKSSGYRVWRDPAGNWHTYRPDGSEIAPLRAAT
jgi:hypothetical protein